MAGLTKTKTDKAKFVEIVKLQLLMITPQAKCNGCRGWAWMGRACDHFLTTSKLINNEAYS